MTVTVLVSSSLVSSLLFCCLATAVTCRLKDLEVSFVNKQTKKAFLVNPLLVEERVLGEGVPL